MAGLRAGKGGLLCSRASVMRLQAVSDSLRVCRQLDEGIYRSRRVGATSLFHADVGVTKQSTGAKTLCL